nr:TraR/DksA family transcriptional regulator [Gammaproteobacteria bacterium]
MDAARLGEFREALLKLATEFRAEDEAAAGERAPVELDQQSVGRLSRMDALQVQAMAQETSRRRAAELRRIAAALARMEEGEYGYCVECGEEIAVRRLELDPATPLCINCASGR